MSNEIHVVRFNEDRLHLEMKFDGDEYENASVKISLKANDGRMPLEEDVTVPVKTLFAMGYLINMSVRRTAYQYEIEVMEMQKRLKRGKHPFKQIGDQNVKKGKKANEASEATQAN
jgi:hypothetical protein